MKAITAAFVAVFILWVVDVNLNGSRYTDAVTRMIRAAVSSIGVRNDAALVGSHHDCRRVPTPARTPSTNMFFAKKSGRRAGPATSAHIGKQGIRRAVARPYPYVIFYRPDTTGIVVHAVRHAARKPL